jgi:drug/metabolite transporter (DMT)-like permease
MKKALFELNIAVMLWGFTGVLGKLIQLNEGWLVWYRLLISLVTVWLLNLKLKEIERIPVKDIISICCIGGLQAIHWVLFFGSVNYSNVSIALVSFSSAALFTSIMEPLLNRKKLKIPEVLLGLAGMVGIYLVFHFDTRYEKGIILGVLSAFMISLTPVFIKRYLTKYHPSTVTAWNMTGGWLILSALLPGYLYFFPLKNNLPLLSDWPWLIILACLCTVFTWRLALTALKKVSAFTLSLMLNLEPVYGIIMAFIIFKEHEALNRYFYIGFFIILLSVAIHIWRVMKQKTN